MATGAEEARRGLRERVRRSSLAERVEALIDAVEYRVAEGEDDLARVQRHRHDRYLRAEHIEPMPTGVLDDEMDRAPATRCYMVLLAGRLAATIRLSLVTAATPEGLSLACFPETVGSMLASGLTVLDPNRLTTDEEIAAEYPELHFCVLRLAALASVHYGADYCLASVQPRHGAFYRRYLKATSLSEPRLFPGVTREVALFASHVPTALAHARRNVTFNLARPGEAERVFVPRSALLPDLDAGSVRATAT